MADSPMRAAAIAVLMLCGAAAAASDAKPEVAFFPLGGDAPQAQKDRVVFALRAKLARTGVYEVIDGPMMDELAAQAEGPVTAATSPDVVRKLAPDAQVLVWGELKGLERDQLEMRVLILDLREAKPCPRPLRKTIAEPTDLRFVAEEVLQVIPGVKPFERPSEVAVQDDPVARELWAKNPNLVANGDFADHGAWHAIYMSEKYPPPLSDALPAVDKVCIYRLPVAGAKANNVLAMSLSRTCAENNGMACLSEAIRIEPATRYRLRFRYRSDGPMLHVFVKGYTLGDEIDGKRVEREIYRRQVPPSGRTDGQWVTIVDELNPQHIAFPVQTLRVDLYAYLSPGTVMFDDVVLKAVGPQRRRAKDDAISLPVSRPTGAK